MLKELIKQDMIKFMKEKNKEAVTTIRMVNGAIKNKEIELKRVLTDDEVVIVVNKEVKQYNESLEFAVQNGDETAIQTIKNAIELLSTYLPEQLSDEEAQVIVAQTLEEAGIKDKKQMGLAMKAVMPKLKGKYDGAKINKLVSTILK